jgi:hypothetical protein
MKKIILIITFFLGIITTISAQSPVIKQFREIIKDAPNQFNTIQKELLQDNKEKNYKIYSSTIDDTAISKSVISKSLADGAVYVIRFDVQNLDGMMLKMFTIISGQYITELNEMVASGNYTGKDYNENGESTTQLKDLQGNTVVQYISNSSEHLVVIFGTPQNK